MAFSGFSSALGSCRPTVMDLRGWDCAAVDSALSMLTQGPEVPAIEILVLEGAQLGDGSVLKYLARLPYLQHLDASNCGLGAVSAAGASAFEGLEECPSLRRLILSNNGFEAVPPLSWCPNIEVLALDGNAISDLPEELTGLPFLRELYLQGNRIASISLPGPCPALGSLDLSGNLLGSDAGLEAFPALQRLSLAGNRITRLERLSPAHTPWLASLNLAGNPLRNLEGFRRLTGFALLRELGVTRGVDCPRGEEANGNGENRGKEKSGRGEDDSASSPCPLPIPDLDEARSVVLGDLLARSDEVACAVGRNRAQEPFPQAPTADARYFERLQAEAMGTLSEPADRLRAMLVALVPQVSAIDGRAVTGEEALGARRWLDPPGEFLAVGHVGEYF